MSTFSQALLRATGTPVLQSFALDTIQVNVGLRCNLECQHCHLGAGPNRSEVMSLATMEQVLALAAQTRCTLVDITGGAPELHPQLIPFITSLRQQGITVQLRSNLAVLLLPEMKGLPEFLRDQRIRLVGSMPCYLEANVNAQRGAGTHRQLVAAIRLLNQLGYGRDPELILSLVYNPGGPVLPPNQCKLEADYRQELAQRDGLFFTNLLTIANMPIGRFRASLRRLGQESAYLTLLTNAFNPQTLGDLMCRRQISVGWDGRLYDCDFNLALGFAVAGASFLPAHDLNALLARDIVTGDHCLACTAGAGSSCGGALAA